MGQSISPRCKRAAIAATKDKEPCKHLASMDILRVGKRREIQLALKMLGNICMSHKDNMIRIKIVHNTLGEFANGSFVGGATVSLCTDRMTDEVRPTDDIDILIELTGHVDYAALE